MNLNLKKSKMQLKMPIMIKTLKLMIQKKSVMKIKLIFLKILEGYYIKVQIEWGLILKINIKIGYFKKWKKVILKLYRLKWKI